MTQKPGWTGRFFEDFEVTAPVHVDHHYASQTQFGKPLVNSTLTLALITGQSVTDVSQNVMANLGRLPAPVFEATRSIPNRRL